MLQTTVAMKLNKFCMEGVLFKNIGKTAAMKNRKFRQLR